MLVESGVRLATDSDTALSGLDPGLEMARFSLCGTRQVRWGIVSAFCGDTGKAKTRPTGKTLSPAFSPDGRSLAFTRWSAGRSDTLPSPPRRELRAARITGEGCRNRGAVHLVRSLDADGSEIVFSRGFWSSGSLWRMKASCFCEAPKAPVPSEDVGPLAVSRQGNRLAYVSPRWKTSIWRVDLRGPSQNAGRPIPVDLVHTQ